MRQAVLTSWLNTFHHFKSVSKCHEVTQSSTEELQTPAAAAARPNPQNWTNNAGTTQLWRQNEERMKRKRRKRGWAEHSSCCWRLGANQIWGKKHGNTTKKSPRLAIICYYKKGWLNSTQPLYPNGTDPSINNRFELGPKLGPSFLSKDQ